MDKNRIENIIEEVLEEIEVDKNVIQEKTLKRIYDVEVLIQKLQVENSQYSDKIKKNKLSISFFAEDKKIGIVRRSIYGDQILLRYINSRIDNQIDYFNDTKLEKLKEKYNLLEERYLMIIDNIIDNKTLIRECEKYKQDIKTLNRDKDNLKTIIKEKNLLIENLKSNVKSDTIVNLEEKRNDRIKR